MKNLKVIIILAVIVGIGAILGGNYVSSYNYGNQIEKSIAAAYEKNQNTLSQYSNKIGEMAQVPSMYKNDLKELYKEAMGGRYGDGGSKAMMQWIKEVNPSLDPSLYKNIQQAMEAGRTKFENSQNVLIDKKRSYETRLGTFVGGMFLNWAGYPKINLDDFKIIKSSYSNDAFETGVEDGIKLG